MTDKAVARLLPAVSMTPPRFRHDWIEPPALRGRWNVLREHRVVLITALPGSGKTRLMALLASEAQAALAITAWLRCGGCAGNIAVGVATAMAQSVLGDRSATAALLMTADALPSSVVQTVCLNEVAAFAGDVVLFLDDLGTIGDPAEWDALQRLIEDAPDNLRIVMASRSAVRLKLARLINDGALLQIASRDLQLRSDQIAALVTGLGQPHPEPAELRSLADQTQGWVGGLRLLTRRDYGRRGAAAGVAVNPAVLAYFEEEVLAALSDEARGALDTILLPHVLREDLLCDLAGGAGIRDHLAELEAHCLLTAVHGDHGIVYHAAPLLVSVARQVRLIDDDEALALHRRCSEWFECHAEPQAAAAHAIDAGDDNRAIHLIDRCGMAMIAQGQVTALQHWMSRLSLDRVRRRPQALVAVAWALSLLYRLDEALPLITAIEEDLGDGNNEIDNNALRASVAAMRVMHLSMRDDVAGGCRAARDWIKRFGRGNDWATYVVDNSLSFALAQLGAINEARLVLDRAYLPNFYAQGPYAAIYSRCILGLIDLRDGQVRRAEANFAWALKAAETDADFNSTGAVMAAGLLAGARYERHDLVGARRLLDSYAWSMHGHLFTDARFQAYRTIARDQVRRHQYRAAISTLEQVLDAGPAVRLVRLHIDVLAEKIQVALAQHDLGMARTYIRALDGLRCGITGDPGQNDYRDACTLGSQASLDMVAGDWDIAATTLRQAIRLDLRTGWRLRAIHWTVLMVRALWRSGRRDRAMRIMDRLVGHAAGSGIVATILDGGPDIAQVLERIAVSGGVMERRKSLHLRRLREAFDPTLVETDVCADDPSSPRDSLTAREFELIRLVRSGLTNRQIAARMQVSENTIKWHLKNVFEKVSVKKRADLAGVVLPRTADAPPDRPPAKRVVSHSRPAARPISTMRGRDPAAEQEGGE